MDDMWTSRCTPISLQILAIVSGPFTFTSVYEKLRVSISRPLREFRTLSLNSGKSKSQIKVLNYSCKSNLIESKHIGD